MYESVYNINTYMYIMSGILKNPFQQSKLGDVDNREIPILMANFAISQGGFHTDNFNDVILADFEYCQYPANFRF